MKKRKNLPKIHNGALHTIEFKTFKGVAIYTVLSIVMIVHLLIVFIPIVWMILMCFKEPAEIYSTAPSFFPKSFDFGKIAVLWNQLGMYTYYLNTFIMGLGCVISDVVIDGLAGYSLSRLKPRGSRWYFALVSVTMLLPATCAMVPNYILYKDLGMLNTYFPMWLIAGTNMFNVLLFKSAFDGISISLIEAAMIDGASDLKTFIKIVVPISKPIIATCAIFTFNASFGDFFWPYILITDPGKRVIGQRLFEIKSSPLSIDSQMVAALFAVLPQVIIFILFQKNIMAGINVGGVKG